VFEFQRPGEGDPVADHGVCVGEFFGVARGDEPVEFVVFGGGVCWGLGEEEEG